MKPENEGKLVRDQEAFIIQLNDEKIFKVENPDKAMWYYKGYLLCIGTGFDICIYKDCDNN